MLDVRHQSLYDHPRYYDLLFGSDWRAEFEFLRHCFARYALRPVRRVFEPACGSGRVLRKLAAAGYRTSGLDLNPRMVDFCRDRARSAGLAMRIWQADMADFRLPQPVDAAFNLVGSFQHLADEPAALGHLQSVSAALAAGGIYVLTLQLAARRRRAAEAWSVRRGHLALMARMESRGLDPARRCERIRTTVDVYTPRQQFRLQHDAVLRSYTTVQFRRLLAKVPQLQIVATHDFAYDVEQPITVSKTTEDVVYVLQKCPAD